MAHSVYIVDISKPLAHTTYTLYLPGTVETGINPLRAHFSSLPVAIEGEHVPTDVSYDAELQSGQDPGEYDETVSDSLCRNSSVVRTHSFISCPGGWSQTILQVEAGWTYCHIL
jgi:hypothetical protein